MMDVNSLRNTFLLLHGEKAYTGLISNGEYEVKNKYAHFIENSLISVLNYISKNGLYKNGNGQWETAEGELVCDTDQDLIILINELENGANT